MQFQDSRASPYSQGGSKSPYRQESNRQLFDEFLKADDTNTSATRSRTTSNERLRALQEPSSDPEKIQQQESNINFLSKITELARAKSRSLSRETSLSRPNSRSKLKSQRSEEEEAHIRSRTTSRHEPLNFPGLITCSKNFKLTEFFQID